MKKHSKIKGLLVQSGENLTLSDRRFFNYLLFHAFDGLKKSLQFDIGLNELLGVFGVSYPSINHIQASARRLLKTTIEFEKDDNEWIVAGLFARLKWCNQENKIFYSYSNECKQIFLNPILLEKCLIQAHFILKYSNLLYELLADAFYRDKKQFVIEISELRKWLHVGDKKLANYNDLDRFILMPATKEINSYASFKITYSTERKGMKVTHLKFDLTKKREIALDNAKDVIPPKRPPLLIDTLKSENAYAFILNVDTKTRRKFFDLACKKALRKKIILPEEIFDCPDLWFKFVESEIIHIITHKFCD